jgi:hypothetical protein
LPIFYIYVFVQNINFVIGSSSFIVASAPFGVAALINILVILLIFFQKDKKLKLYDALIKISMLIGVLATFYVGYLHV